MFKEFNVKFENVEMIGGSDNLLENTRVTKVISKGDNKMSSLDSTLKNCSELDTIDGELDLNGVSDIDNILQGTELVKSISLKNINNENISANNSFPHIEEINIGGEVYDKRAMQNVIASKDWTFDNLTYSGIVGDNIVTKEVDMVDNNKVTIKDTLEQKAKGIEIIGQTYENLVVGSGEVTLLDELTLESVDGSPNEFNPHIEQPVCVETIEGETYQNLVDGKGEYKLTDTFSTTWTESNNSIENPPSMIEIPEIWGNTIQDETDLSNIQSVGDLYVDENNETILDDEGNEQYRLDITTDNIIRPFVDTTYRKYISSKRFNDKQFAVLGDYVYQKSKCITYIRAKIDVDKAKSGYFIAYGQGGDSRIYFNKDTRTLNFKGTYANANIPLTDIHTVVSNEIFEIKTVYEGNSFRMYVNDSLVVSSDTLDNLSKSPYSNIIINSQYQTDYSNGCNGIYIECGLVEFDSGILNDNIQTSKTTILMPCQLSMIISNQNDSAYLSECDKLYYDISSNKYLIKKNISEYTTPNINYQGELDIELNLPSDMISSNNLYDNYPFIMQDAKVRGWVRPTDNCFGVKRYRNDTSVRLATSNAFTNEEVSSFLSNKKILYITSSPQVIETKILEKPSLETYSPKTYISANSEVQPSQMAIVNKQTIFKPLGLSSNTDYTIQLDSIGKNDKSITVNLGGTETTIQPVNDTNKHHKVTIKTPSTLTSDKLELSGEGVVVNDIMLFEGGSNDIKQEVEYVEGIESTGELQEDGTYKIDILSNNGNKIFDADTWVNSTLNDGTALNSGFYKVLGSNMIEIIANDTRTPDRVKQIQLKPNTKYSMLCNDASLIIYIYFKLQGTGQISGRSKIDFTTDETGRIGFKIPNGVGKIVKIDIVDEKGFNYSAWSTQSILLPQPLNKIGDIKDKFYWDDDKGHYCIEQNIDENLEVLDTPNTIDLPHLNKKYSLDTYMPTTYLECTNSPMQPSRILLESDTVRYKPSALETDTDYTIQFECKEKSDKKVKLNLGGSEKEVDAEVGLNHVSITTPSELSKDRLFISGVGNKVADVIVAKGEMSQYPEYFDGVQSVGVLQDDGTYKIDIETSSSVGDNLLSYSNFVSGHLLNGNVVNPEATITHTESSLICNTNGISWRGCSSNYIEIDPTKKYFYEYTTSVTNYEYWYSNVSFYDESKRYISHIITTGWISIPNNAKYLRVCYQSGFAGTFTISNMKLFTPTISKTSIHLGSHLAKRDKLYWNKSNKRYEIDRGGSIEVPAVEGDIIDLPRLYQREDTNINISTGNIKPSEIKIEYLDID